MEDVLFLIVVHALYHLWPHKRALGDDTFEGYHPIQMIRAQGSGIACEFAEASNVGAIVHLFLLS